MIVPTPENLRPTTLEEHHRLEQFLFHEAALLDSFRFRDWLELLAEDLHYWAPVRENRTFRERKHEISPPGTSAYFDDTRDHMSQRVDRLYTHMAWAEEPPSRTRHIVTNVQAWAASDTEFVVHSAFYCHRTRTERDHDWIVGKREDLIRTADSEAGFELARRMVLFDVSTIIIKNLSVFY